MTFTSCDEFTKPTEINRSPTESLVTCLRVTSRPLCGRKIYCYILRDSESPTGQIAYRRLLCRPLCFNGSSIECSEIKTRQMAVLELSKRCIGTGPPTMLAIQAVFIDILPSYYLIWESAEKSRLNPESRGNVRTVRLTTNCPMRPNASL